MRLFDRIKAVFKPTSYVTSTMLDQALTPIKENLVSTQADVDALVAQLKQEETDIAEVSQAITDASARIQAELDSLQSQIDAGGTVDLSTVQTEVQNLSDAIAPLAGAVEAIGEEQPTQPEPPASS